MLGLLILMVGISTDMIFDFKTASNISNWQVVNDGVMGGVSKGSFTLNSEGHGVFKGNVSLDNYGGFTSVRYGFQKINLEKKAKIIMRLKGDGKNYQFRIKANTQDYYAYISTFSTTGKWQEVEIVLADLYPSFRGRKLDQPNFSNTYMEEITLLIANKKAEEFKLLIDEIYLKE